MTLELRGDIPGLLRRGSPVQWQRLDGVRDGVCYFAPLRPSVPLVTHDPCREPGCPDPADLRLDLTDPTGRLHARLWLAERGHDIGSEDRAEVLAWSVLSVYRGGRPLRVAPQWNYNARYLEGGYWIARVRDHGWSVGDERGEETGDAGKAAADAALLRLGWALTNADGTLTLPPLPGAA